MLKIYHNNRCSKSRGACQILQESGQAFETIEYLNAPPSEAELKDILKMLGLKPLELIRKGEQIFKDEYKGKELSDAEWIAAMLKHPRLIERPIAVKDGKAVIGRPPERVLELL